MQEEGLGTAYIVRQIIRVEEEGVGTGNIVQWT